MLPTVIGVASLIVAIAVACTGAIRNQYDRVSTTIQDCTNGAAVCAARQRLGLFIHSTSGLTDKPIVNNGKGPCEHYRYLLEYLNNEGTGNSVETLVDDLFTVQWAFIRINAVAVSLPTLSPFRGPHQLLETSFVSWTRYWQRFMPPVSWALSEKLVDMNRDELQLDPEGLDSLAKKWLKGDRSSEGGRKSAISWLLGPLFNTLRRLRRTDGIAKLANDAQSESLSE